MGLVTGRLQVETLVKTMVCEVCRGLRSSRKPHRCPGQKVVRVAGGKVVLLAKRKTTVLVASDE
jgi:hypothetical protein